MTKEIEKAVALELAKKHTQSIVRVSNDGEPLSGTVLLTFEGLAAMLADHRQQIIEELAQGSGVMPIVMCVAGDLQDDVPVITEARVREAIASLEARLHKATLGWDASRLLLEQSEARVRELEKDAARYRWFRKVWTKDYMEFKASPMEPVMNCFSDEEMDAAIDAAINKESGK